ncbi:flavin-containing monooxygenase [Cesiribacter andamanensis]|uniref:4-hydroxyacetophenone monooxygenase n=1 Tax=Cesiribacter andamanensis AMV16 TaxID=1279009 RepID=M7N582_9BACT|nr:NAD(P)/FAD-dependent oxidoreductase [Cesiribacter andamanensis]EMR02457.1 4-hydroxyacetophenone monooxygenase [Cesiribacter andamanensis AMV16]
MSAVDYQVGIIGAGFAGLVAALRLKKSGRDSFIIFERASEVGGTWRDNVYPGCACDVTSPLYSFADEPNPDWSRRYSTQPEILAYLKGVVARRGLDEHISYQADIVEARFLEQEGCWQLSDRQGRSWRVVLLLLALGPLNRPHMPHFPGLEDYKGRYFHSSQWETDFSLKGKRVAVIGTGASAIQIVPGIAPEVAQLVVLQRTPAWVGFRNDKPVSALGRWLNRHFPLWLRAKREAVYWLNETIGLGLVGNAYMNRLIRWLALRKLAKEVHDPLVRQQLTPQYTIGCKRILRSDDNYPTFNRPNVQLVTAPIARFTGQGIRTADGADYPLDAVIFATGFVAADITFYTRVLGLQGRSLTDEWKEKGAEAYLGTTVAGYPNMGFLLGPNTGLGHNSVVHIMESQMTYLMQYLQQLEQAAPGSYLEVRQEVQAAYNRRIQQQLQHTVWASGCKSWYLNKEGKNTTLYPRLTVHYRRESRRFDPAAYRLHQPVAQPQPPSSITA